MTTLIPAVLAEALDGEARPQSPFLWTKQPWLDQMHDLPDVLSLLDRLPERVSRQSTVDAVSAELNAGRVLPAFIAAMVWGWGTTAGMGALRTRWILTQTKAKEHRRGLGTGGSLCRRPAGSRSQVCARRRGS
jgi:hypothetical protein